MLAVRETPAPRHKRYSIPPLPSMRTKTALTIGVIGTAGAISTYLYNRPALRKKMLKAGSPSEAAKAFTAALEKDTAEIVETVKDATMHNWLMDELRAGKDAIAERLSGAAAHMKSDAKEIKKQAKRDIKAAKLEAGHVQKKLQSTAKKAVEAVKEKVGV